MELTTYRRQGDTLVVQGSLTSPIDMKFDLETRALLDAAEAGGLKDVTIDVRGVGAMVSQYIEALAAVAADMKKHGGGLTVRATGEVAELLRQCGLDQVMALDLEERIKGRDVTLTGRFSRRGPRTIPLAAKRPSQRWNEYLRRCRTCLVLHDIRPAGAVAIWNGKISGTSPDLPVRARLPAPGPGAPSPAPPHRPTGHRRPRTRAVRRWCPGTGGARPGAS